jgi:hypothetical protein
MARWLVLVDEEIIENNCNSMTAANEVAATRQPIFSSCCPTSYLRPDLLVVVVVLSISLEILLY